MNVRAEAIVNTAAKDDINVIIVEKFSFFVQKFLEECVYSRFILLAELALADIADFCIDVKKQSLSDAPVAIGALWFRAE